MIEDKGLFLSSDCQENSFYESKGTISASSLQNLNELNATNVIISNKKKNSNRNNNDINSISLNQVIIVKNKNRKSNNSIPSITTNSTIINNNDMNNSINTSTNINNNNTINDRNNNPYSKSNDIEHCIINNLPEDNEDGHVSPDTSMDQLIIDKKFNEKQNKNKLMKLTSSSSKSSLKSFSSFASNSTIFSDSSSTMTINTLSQQKNDRIVRYWYKDNQNNCMNQKTSLCKNENSLAIKNNNFKQNVVWKQDDKKLLRPTSLLETITIPPKVKRSSLVNFKPTNIDINNIPNISATTTTNTILNSNSVYRGEKNQKNQIHCSNNINNINFDINNNEQNEFDKELIIRDLNANDNILYSLKINKAATEKLDLITTADNGKLQNSINHKGQAMVEKTEINSPVTPTTPTSPTSSVSSTSTLLTDKAELKKAAKRFSHRRQNSVRLQISY